MSERDVAVDCQRIFQTKRANAADRMTGPVTTSSLLSMRAFAPKVSFSFYYPAAHRPGDDQYNLIFDLERQRFGNLPRLNVVCGSGKCDGGGTLI